MNKLNLKKWFRLWRHHHGAKDPLKRRPRPFRDWHRLIIWWLILLVAVGTLHLWTFRNMQNKIGRGSETVAPAPLPPLDPTRLHQVIKYWQTREPGYRPATTTGAN